MLTQPATLLPLGEVFEAVGGAALRLLVLLDVPGQFGGDVGDKVAAGPQTVIVAPHSELTVLERGTTQYKGCQYWGILAFVENKIVELLFSAKAFPTMT